MIIYDLQIYHMEDNKMKFIEFLLKTACVILAAKILMTVISDICCHFAKPRYFEADIAQS